MNWWFLVGIAAGCLYTMVVCWIVTKVLRAEFCRRKMKYLRIKWWIYLPVYVYRGMLRWRGKYDPDEPMLPEWMTSDEKRAVCHKMYERNILI